MDRIIKITIVDSGNRPNDTTYDIYGNLDGYVTPIVTGVEKVELIDPNNPYILTLDDGITVLRLLDVLGDCYLELPITSSTIE